MNRLYVSHILHILTGILSHLLNLPIGSVLIIISLLHTIQVDTTDTIITRKQIIVDGIFGISGWLLAKCIYCKFTNEN